MFPKIRVEEEPAAGLAFATATGPVPTVRTLMPSEASLGDFFVILVCPKTEKKALSSRQKGYVTIKKID